MSEQEILATIFGATLAALMLILIIGLAVAVFMIIVYWKMFSKAGEAGWKAIIPIYNTYILFKVAKIPLVFFAWLICTILMWFDNSAINIIGYLGVLVTWIVLDVKIASSFGKSAGFAVGLIFLPIIFFPILAFGSATYQGDEQTA